MEKIRLRNIIRKVIDNDYDILLDSEHRELSEFYAELTNEILLNYPNDVDVAYAMNRIIDSACMNCVSRIHGSWIHNGYQYVADSYRSLKSSKLFNVMEISTDVTPVNVDNVFEEEKTSDLTISVPTIPELKNLIRECQVTNKKVESVYNRYIYAFDCGLCVNVEYLLDAIVATGARELRTYTNNGKFNKPIFLSSNSVTAMVLPIYDPNNHYERGKITQW